MKLQKISLNGELVGFQIVPETDAEKTLLLEVERNNNRSKINSNEHIVINGVDLDSHNNVTKMSFEKLKYHQVMTDVFERIDFEKNCVIEDAH